MRASPPTIEDPRGKISGNSSPKAAFKELLALKSFIDGNLVNGHWKLDESARAGLEAHVLSVPIVSASEYDKLAAIVGATGGNSDPSFVAALILYTSAWLPCERAGRVVRSEAMDIFTWDESRAQELLWDKRRERPRLLAREVNVGFGNVIYSAESWMVDLKAGLGGRWPGGGD